MLDWRGRTALVTGASAGIGRAIARELAPDLGRIVLVARRRERLLALGDELRAAHPGLEVTVEAVDLCDRAAVDRALEALAAAGIAVDVLVNNAGFGDYGLFEARRWPKIERMLELNVVGATFLLHRLVPGMVARGFGAVLNVGSSAGMIASPSMGSYAASKAYLNHLSEALRAELAGTGVSVTALCPGPVPTEFQEVAETRGRRKPSPSLLRVDVEHCARDAVAALRRGDARCIPGLPLRVAVLSLESLPRAVVRPFLARAGRAQRVAQRAELPSRSDPGESR